ncbi:MAG: DUF3078 domain-containing protein [Bacteroidales bacterium]|nr:DUF3078 domain-containing protein [Bacteroidales bacterium]
MKRKLAIILTTTFLCQLTFGQTTEPEKHLRTVSADTINGWKKGGVINIGLSQTSLTNWAAGGQSSFAANGLLSLFANYKKSSLSWDNTLDVGYGVMQQGEDATFLKTDDKIDMVSKIGMKATKNLYYALLFNFKTQMAPGYNYPNDSVKISDFLAPGYFMLAIGMDYKPKDNISVFLAPLTAKMTMVNDQNLANAGAFGVEKAVYDTAGVLIQNGKKTLVEFGGYLRFQYKKEIMKNILFQTKLDLFSNYLKDPQNIVVNWENLISFKVNKFISATITTNLIYDDKIKIAIDKNNDGIVEAKGPRTQFKEILSIGFSYKF